MTSTDKDNNQAPSGPSIVGVIGVCAIYAMLLALVGVGLHAYISYPWTQETTENNIRETNESGQSFGSGATNGSSSPANNSLSSTQKKDLIQATAIAMGGGVAAAGIYFTWKTLQVTLWSNKRNVDLTRTSVKQTTQTIEQTQKGQTAERFTRAIDQIGSTALELRIGGIFSLEAIARDNPEYRSAVVETLSAYIRHRFPYSPNSQYNYPRPQEVQRGEPSSSVVPPKRFDLNAILDAFRRTLKKAGCSEKSERGSMTEPLNLHKVDLRRADLTGIDLEGADLSTTNLHGADLTGVSLKETYLYDTDLKNAFLTGANLLDATLEEANLSLADLADIKNYTQIKSIRKANIFRVSNAPEGFREWALEEGALEATDNLDWFRQKSGLD